MRAVCRSGGFSRGERGERKNDSTLTITAHNFKDGKDLTKDMILIIDGNNIIMQQGNFKAAGKREGNVYYLKGNFEDKEYRFRLYTMGDKYIFHNEVWADGQFMTGRFKMDSDSYRKRTLFNSSFIFQFNICTSYSKLIIPKSGNQPHL